LTKFVRIYDNLKSGTIAEYPWKTKGRYVRVLDEEAFASVIYSRNRFVIPDAVHESLRRDVFAAGGLAVGGDTAYLFMLSGVENWIVADGGLLDLHDFNRVIGGKVEDIGTNQAIRWTKMALERDPFLEIRCIPRNLGVETNSTQNIISYDDFLVGVDRVIEAVDNFPVKGGLRLKTGVVMPTDLGMGAKVEEDKRGVPFHGRLSVEEMDQLMGSTETDINTRTQLAIKIVGLENIPPSYLQAVKDSRENRVPFWPQPGVAAFLSAAMMVAREVALRSGLPVKEEAAIDLIKEVTLSE
jgi:hypothetical protein